jgi:tripartite-type tricarboxylate transporter receptor subunit TctC
MRPLRARSAPRLSVVVARAALAAVLAAAAGVAAAQSYPARPIRLIVPYAPGGTADVLCRELAARVSASVGQQVLVENRGGANGVIGAEALARSTPDGYTIGLMSSSHAALPFATKLPFDPAKDVAPLMLIAIVPGLLSVHASVGAKNLQELLALARAQPGKLAYGHPGSLSAAHLAMEALKLQTKVDVTAVPYKGGGPALADLLSGQIQMSVSGPTAHLPHIANNRLRPIAVTAARRSTAVPETPTIAESGLPGFDSSEWYGLFTPAAMAADHVERLSAEFMKAMRTPEMQARMATVGAEGVGNTPREFAEFFRAEMDKNGRLIRQLGLKVE